MSFARNGFLQYCAFSNLQYYGFLLCNFLHFYFTINNPHFDENYIEKYGFLQLPDGKLSASLRIGTARYLRFPYPDAIAMFDQVPGIADLSGVRKTGYSGEIMSVEYAHNSGFGAHYSGIRWDFGREAGTQSLEKYLFYTKDIGKFHFETRYGGLAVRPEPVGRTETGFNTYLGVQSKRYSAGLLYEKLRNNPAYTGIMVTFPLNETTKALGQVAFDYDRSPQGFAMQVQVGKGLIGDIVRQAPADAILVGEIHAERVRTYWQNGQARNYYEHRISQWGEVGRLDLVVYMEEQPWYLQAEALVSPHTFNDGFEKWEKDRQGPAQLCQKVVYKFYRKEKAAK